MKSNEWVVGDYKVDGKLRRNVVMKRTTRKNRFGFRVHSYTVQDNRRSSLGWKFDGYRNVWPTKVSCAFKTQLEARERKWKLEGRL